MANILDELRQAFGDITESANLAASAVNDLAGEVGDALGGKMFSDVAEAALELAAEGFGPLKELAADLASGTDLKSLFGGLGLLVTGAGGAADAVNALAGAVKQALSGGMFTDVAAAAMKLAADGFAPLQEMASRLAGDAMWAASEALAMLPEELQGPLALVGKAAREMIPFLMELGAAVGGRVSAALSMLGPAASAAGTSLGLVSSGAQTVVSGFALVGKAVEASIVALGVFATGLVALGGMATDVASGGLSLIVTGAQKVVAGLAILAQMPQQLLGQMGDAVKDAVGAMVKLAGAGIVDAFNSIGGQMKSFVGSLNPAAAQMFDFVMRDMSATVGTALMPAFQVLTQVARQTANMMLPMAQALAPAFGEIASAIGGAVVPMLGVFVEGVKSLVPLLTLTGQAMGYLVPVAEAVGFVFQQAFRTFGDLMQSLVGGDEVKSSMERFRDGLKMLATNLVIAAGAIAKVAADLGFKPAEKFLNDLVAAAKTGKVAPEAKDTTGLGAATGGRTTSIEGFRSSMLASAFTAAAGGATKKKDTADWLADAVSKLDGIQSGQVDANAWLEEKWEELKIKLREETDYALDNIKGRISELSVRLLREVFGDEQEATQAAKNNFGAGAGVPGLQAGMNWLFRKS